MSHTIQNLAPREPSIYRDEGNTKLAIIDRDERTDDRIKAVAHSDGSYIVYVGDEIDSYVRILHVEQKTDGKFGELMEWVIDDMDNNNVQFWNIISREMFEAFDSKYWNTREYAGETVHTIELEWNDQ